LRTAHLPHLHSFPTRRSSDLQVNVESLRAHLGRRARLYEQRPPARRAQLDVVADEHVARTDADARGSDARIDQLRVDIGSIVAIDRKSTRLNSSHDQISYAVL